MTVTTEVYVLRENAIVGVVMVVFLVRKKNVLTLVLDMVLVLRLRRELQDHQCNVLVIVDGQVSIVQCLIVQMTVLIMESVIMVLVTVIVLLRVLIVPFLLSLVPTTALVMVFALRSLEGVCAVVSGTEHHVISGCTPLMDLSLTLVVTIALIEVCVCTLTMEPLLITVNVLLIVLDPHVRLLVRLDAVVMVDVSEECVDVMMVGLVIVVNGVCVLLTVTIMVTVVMVCACVRLVMLVRIVVCSLKKLCHTSVLSIVLPSASRLAHLCIRWHLLMVQPRPMIAITSVQSLVYQNVNKEGYWELLMRVPCLVEWVGCVKG